METTLIIILFLLESVDSIVSIPVRSENISDTVIKFAVYNLLIIIKLYILLYYTILYYTVFSILKAKLVSYIYFYITQTKFIVIHIHNSIPHKPPGTVLGFETILVYWPSWATSISHTNLVINLPYHYFSQDFISFLCLLVFRICWIHESWETASFIL